MFLYAAIWGVTTYEILLHRESKLHFEFNLAVLLYFVPFLCFFRYPRVQESSRGVKKFIHSSVSGLRLPPSVSLYRSHNPIPESAASNYAATCASFRAHRNIMYATAEMR